MKSPTIITGRLSMPISHRPAVIAVARGQAALATRNDRRETEALGEHAGQLAEAEERGGVQREAEAEWSFVRP